MARLRYFWRLLTGWLAGWWANIKKPLFVFLLIVVAVVVVLYLLIEAGYAYPWIGFGPYTPPQPPIEGYQREKTTWDWLQLLIIPIVLAVGGFFLNRTERMNSEKAAEQRAQDTALQAFLEAMTKLLLDKHLRTSQPDDEVRSVARARTLTVLRVLDGARKATVLQFLYEARLIGGVKWKEDGSGVSGWIDAIVSLEGADLSGANLERAHLQEAHLEGAHLRGAHLDRAHLQEAHLQGAILVEVNLRETDLHWADLEGAFLFGAKLGRANLEGANLERADLRLTDLRLTDLRLADLRLADLTDCIVTREQLAHAKSLEGAKLPFDMTPPPAPEVEVRTPEDQATDLREATMPDGSKYE